MRGMMGPTKVPHKYADMETREILGLTMNNAVIDAKNYAEEHGVETIVYFQRWDADMGNRYDYDEFDGPTCDSIRADRIVWSSEEGYY